MFVSRFIAAAVLCFAVSLSLCPAMAEEKAAPTTQVAAVSDEAPNAPEKPAAESGQPTSSAAASYPPGLLMDGLGAAKLRGPFDATGIRLWGFAETGFTGRLTGGQHPLPNMGFEGPRPNNLSLHQLRLTADRPYDSNKSVDFGGRIDGLFGGDAMFTHSPGLFAHAGEGNGDEWADLLQAYAQGWFKTGKDSGLELTFGKFVCPCGYEVVDAIGNPLFTHSYLFNALPFTNTGAKANYVFNSQASAYFAVVEGWDVFQDNNNAVSYMAGGSLAGAEQIDGHARLQYFLNVLTGPEQNDNVSNYRTIIDNTVTYWWTSQLSQAVNFDYGTEEDVPDIGRARWYGVANYMSYKINDYFTPIWRAEWFRDDGGARTGVDCSYYENTWGLNITPWPNHQILKNLLFRPEFRWDFADKPAFGNDYQNQLTASIDMIFRF